MSRSPWPWLLIGCAWAAASREARAAGEATPDGAHSDFRREVVFAGGYGPIVAFAPLTVHHSAAGAERTSTLTGLALEIMTRRVPMFELGTFIWSASELSDWQGSYGHMLSRWTFEARVLPWKFRTVEPWIGAELGGAMANDYAAWAKTDKAVEHIVSTTHFGSAAALHVGARVRAGDLIAFNLRAGLLFLGFGKLRAKCARPTERRRISSIRLTTDEGSGSP